MELQEYLDSIEDEGRRSSIAGALDAVFECFEWDFISLPADQRELNISVYEDDKVQALASERARLIRFSTGLVKHYEQTRFPDITSLIPGASFVLGANWVMDLGLTWSLSHEFVHIYRKHDSVEDAILAASGATARVEARLQSAINLTQGSIQKALEHDADLCAAAKIYRYIQRRCSKVVEDIILRKMALFYVYWGIRTLPENSHGDSHPAMYERLYEITNKLAQVPTDFRAPYIVGQDLDQQLKRAAVLAELAMDLERAYIADSGQSEIDAYWYKWFIHINSRERTQRAKDWQKVSPWVEKISGTIADNRKDVFYYRQKSAEKIKGKKKIKRKSQRVARRNKR